MGRVNRENVLNFSPQCRQRLRSYNTSLGEEIFFTQTFRQSLDTNPACSLGSAQWLSAKFFARFDLGRFTPSSTRLYTDEHQERL
jgi:hypothetical protein